MTETNYIPFSLIDKIYSEIDSTQEHNPPCTIIKLKSGETWKTTYDITLAKHGSGIEGGFEKSI